MKVLDKIKKIVKNREEDTDIFDDEKEESSYAYEKEGPSNTDKKGKYSAYDEKYEYSKESKESKGEDEYESLDKVKEGEILDGAEKDNDSVNIVSKDIARAIEEKTGRTEEDDERVHRYHIGGYIFDTYYEYRNAEDDIKRIEIIKKNINIKDPEAAVKLYNMIREGKIEFKSTIGERFFDYVGDVVAERSVDLLEDKKVVDEAEGHAKTQKWFAILVIFLAIISFSYFLKGEIKDILVAQKMKRMQQEALKKKDMKHSTKKDRITLLKRNDKFAKNNQGTAKAKEILPEYKDAHEKNPEMIGWLNIIDTNVNYPVMQKKNNNEYYLTHSFDNMQDKNGCIFMDYRSNYESPTTNTIIYGHDTSTGLMFGDLKKFLKKDFYEAHTKIEFNTLYERREYQIVAIGLSQVAYKDEKKYRYYNFIEARTKKDWDDFYNSINSQNIYGNSIDIDVDDQLLTLSTCNSYMKDGRLFLVAKRIK